MGRIIQTVLLEHISELNDRLNTDSGLLDWFMSTSPGPPVLSLGEKDEIINQRTSYKRNDKFLTLLMAKDDRALDILYTFLRESGSLELAALLEKSADALGYRFPGATVADPVAHLAIDEHRTVTSSTSSNCRISNKDLESSEETENILLGIDLGTTYSCAGIWRNGNVSIVKNEFGRSITASYVAFDDEFAEKPMLVGDAAKSQAATNPRNTIFDVKRLIGRQFGDPAMQSDLERWPYKVTATRSVSGGQMPIFVVGKPEYTYTPEQISSFILTKLKRMAEESEAPKGKCKIMDAVISARKFYQCPA